MTFEALVSRLQSLYDVDRTRAAEVGNERLQRMVGEAKSLKSLKTLGTTVAAQAAYALPTDVVQVERVTIAYAAGVATYKGTESIEALWDLASGDAEGCGNWYAVAPDSDSSGATNNLYLSPAPSEAGATITGVCALIPAAITYATASALPIPLDIHPALLAGAKAELSDEDGRQDEAAKYEAVYSAGIAKLAGRSKSLGTGSDGHRLRVAGHDFRR